MIWLRLLVRDFPDVFGRPRDEPSVVSLVYAANPHSIMAHLFLALFLIVFGLNILLGLTIPPAVPAILAIIAGALLIAEHYRLRVDRK